MKGLFNSLSNMNEELKSLNKNIEYNSIEFYKYVVLGQQAYTTILYNYLFLTVTQDSGMCGKLARQIPKEKLLKLYLHQVDADDILMSQTYGILHKIRRGFAILGLHYQNFGYDSAYSTFKIAVTPFFDEFLLFPITDSTHLLESLAWKYYHEKIVYKVGEIQKFSEKDIIFQASTTFLGKNYSERGYSKKNAIENLASKIVNAAVPKEQYLAIAQSQNYIKIERDAFVFSSSDYKETDNAIQHFSERYNVESFFMHFALLSRSQVKSWMSEQLNINSVVSPQTNVYRLKKTLISLGQEIILLQLLSLILKNNILKLLDFRALDKTVINIAPDEVHEQLSKMLLVDDITESLFDYMNTPIIESSQKAKNQITNCVIAAFFLSNFSPDKKFTQYFSNHISEIYRKIDTPFETDYRFSTIAFLSALNIRVRTNHYELEDGTFHAEIATGYGKNAPAYICENASMKVAKKCVWKDAYNDIVIQLRHFFTAPDADCSAKVLALFIRGIENSEITDIDFFLDFGILNGRNFPNISPISVSKIISRLKSLIKDSVVDRFLKIIYKINDNLYIETERGIYTYSTWLQSIVLNEEFPPQPSTNNMQIEDLYDSIVNPSFLSQKKLIDSNYKFVSKIYPISDSIAKYALEKNPDAYNYLQFISPETEALFENLKREKEEFSDIGSLTLNLDSDTNIIIIDSHKPFHTQIKDFIKELKINRITIACGYCFSSGLSLLKNITDYALSSEIPLELYIGALQKYNEAEPDNMITGIDKKTVKSLNSFLANDNVSLFTCSDRFYHGKLYIFEGDNTSVICMGSSNVSRAAFITNYELNIAFKTNTSSELFNGFSLWVKQLKYHSKEIKYLNESMFGDNELKQDGSVHLTRISLSSMKKRISELSNTEVQYRLNLWMSYSPDFITENLGVLSLPDYFVFVYSSKHLMVFESFQAGNAYFCIHYKDSFEDVINHIATFSKAEIFEFSRMSKRGYHTKNKFTLENNIKSHFKKSNPESPL